MQGLHGLGQAYGGGWLGNVASVSQAACRYARFNRRRLEHVGSTYCTSQVLQFARCSNYSFTPVCFCRRPLLFTASNAAPSKAQAATSLRIVPA